MWEHAELAIDMAEYEETYDCSFLDNNELQAVYNFWLEFWNDISEELNEIEKRIKSKKWFNCNCGHKFIKSKKWKYNCNNFCYIK